MHTELSSNTREWIGKEAPGLQSHVLHLGSITELSRILFTSAKPLNGGIFISKLGIIISAL